MFVNLTGGSKPKSLAILTYLFLLCKNFSSLSSPGSLKISCSHHVLSSFEVPRQRSLASLVVRSGSFLFFMSSVVTVTAVQLDEYDGVNPRCESKGSRSG